MNQDEHTTDAAEAMKVSELKGELKRRGLKTTGIKEELVARLRAAMFLDDQKDDTPNTQADVPSDVSEDDDAETTDGSRCETDGSHDGARRRKTDRSRRTVHREGTAGVLTFRDVEESMRTFSGDDEVNVNRWIQEFEEISDMCGWSDVQRVVYAKRLLRGSAKLFVSFESCSRSWRQLRKALRDEFSPRVNSRQVHKELSSRKKKPNESYQEYVYKMLEIASQAEVDIQSTLQYIIDGIPDDENGKTVLYGAKTVKELRSKLVIYESMKSNMTATSKGKAFFEKKKHHIASADKRFCFNCGAKDHLSAACPSKNKGKKCFKCGGFGHIAANCTDKREVLECNGNDATSKPVKEVRLFNQDITVLIDSGSDISIMRADQYIRIGAPKLSSHSINFRGVGDKTYSTLGYLTTDVIVDNFAYQMTIHVVSDVYAPHNLILGTDFLAQVKVSLSGGRVETVQRLEVADANVPVLSGGGEETFQLFNIVSDHDLLDVGSGKYLEAIENITENYKPQCVKETTVKAKPNPAAAAGLSAPQKKSVPAKVEEESEDDSEEDEDDDEEEEDSEEENEGNKMKGKAGASGTPSLKTGGNANADFSVPPHKRKLEELDQSEAKKPKLDERYEKVEAIEKQRKDGRDVKWILVRKLPLDVTEDKIKTLSSDIVSVHIRTPAQRNAHFLTALVEFPSKENAEENCEKINNATLDGLIARLKKTQREDEDLAKILDCPDDHSAM